MNRTILGNIILGFSLLYGQAVFAHSEDNFWGCEGRKHMVETLKLDTTQREKIKTIKEQFKTEQKANWEQMNTLRTQINQETFSETMDQSKVDNLINTKVQLIGDVIKAKTKAINEVFHVLNAQQKTQFQHMHQEWEEQMHKKFENCHE